MSKRRPWSQDEKHAVIENFQQFIAVGSLPEKEKLKEVQKSLPVLNERTWTQIKHFIRNYINKQEEIY